MVPDNHILHVRFTHFSLYQYDKDCLQLYENESGIFKPRQAFFGYQDAFNVTTNNEALFVFRSDEANNSTGFRAEYEVLKIPGKPKQFYFTTQLRQLWIAWLFVAVVVHLHRFE